MSDDVNRRTVFPVRNICRGGPGKWVYDDRDPLQDDTHALMPWKEYERLTDELADALKNESHYAKEIIEKDKRIEELERDRSLGLEERGYHIITTEQIDAAWSDAWRKYQGTNSTAGFSSLEKVGIVACGGCGGSGKAEYPLEGNYGPCPSCHGHGWKKT